MRKILQRNEKVELNSFIDEFVKARQKYFTPLIYNSYGMILSAHEPFESKESAIENETDIHSDTIVTEIVSKRQSVLDTDVGKELVEQIHDLEFLLEAYRSGRIAERL